MQTALHAEAHRVHSGGVHENREDKGTEKVPLDLERDVGRPYGVVFAEKHPRQAPARVEVMYPVISVRQDAPPKVSVRGGHTHRT